MADKQPIAGTLRLLETEGVNVSGFMEGFRSMLSLMARLAASQLAGRGVAVVFTADGADEAGQAFLYGPPEHICRLIAELTALADRAEAESAARGLPGPEAGAP